MTVRRNDASVTTEANRIIDTVFGPSSRPSESTGNFLFRFEFGLLWSFSLGRVLEQVLRRYPGDVGEPQAPLETSE